MQESDRSHAACLASGGPVSSRPPFALRVAPQSGLGGEDEVFPDSAPGRPCVAVTYFARPPWMVTRMATPPR